MSKIIIIDEKMNTCEIEVNQNILKGLGVKPENVKKHKSRRQLDKEISDYLQSFKKWVIEKIEKYVYNKLRILY